MKPSQDWQFSVSTAVGWLVVRGTPDVITSAAFSFTSPTADHGGGELCDAARDQLQNYFDDPTVAFDLPLQQQGTVFQQRVWRQLQAIPVGQTQTYGQLARRISSGARAVGGACRRNPVAVIVPCHRVVAANGHGGYAGYTAGINLQVKQWLLHHELSHAAS